MKTLQYIGPKKDGERHFSEHTGIVWMPGDQHAVSVQHAAEFLKHPTSWCEVQASGPSAALKHKQTGESQPSQLPAWAKKGIELGASDEQLEAIAQSGGPDSEAGAALWKAVTGTDYKPEAPAAAKPKAVKSPAAKKTAKKAK